MRSTVCSLFLLGAVAAAHADTPVQGTISTTTWTKLNSPYRVLDTVRVPVGETLTIEAGVDVLFDADVPFIVEGSVRAQGTESDSIVFRGGLSEHWDGIWLSGGDSSAFAYARLSDGLADGPFHCSGGALWVQGEETRVSLTNCVLSGNGATAGGAISTDRSALYLTECTLSGNRAERLGIGGALSVSGATVLANCTISGNSADMGAGAISGVITATGCLFAENTAGMGVAAIAGGGTYTDCTFRGNVTGDRSSGGVVVSIDSYVHCTPVWAGGLFIDDRPILETTFTRCRFIENATWNAPILIVGDSLCHVTFTSCTISGNHTSRGFSAIEVTLTANNDYTQFPATRRRAVIKLENTVIAGNTGSWGSAVGAECAEVSLLNCTVAGNRKVFLHPGGVDTTGGISVSLGEESQGTIVNSILWDNGSPEGFGPETSVRYCDVMGGWEGEGSINLDPLFVDPANGDYRLQPGSPAISAGDPLAPPDLYGTPVDMGAIPYDRPLAVKADSRPLPFALDQNHPNPFNAATTLRFTIPTRGIVNVAVYDVNGRFVRTLVEGTVEAGAHEVVWDGRDALGREVSSGVYLYRLTDAGRTPSARGTIVRRMVLVR